MNFADPGAQAVPAWPMDRVDPAHMEAYGSESKLLEQNKKKKGCDNGFCSCLKNFWMTRQMTQGGSREVYIRTTLRELFVYILFLAILCFLTFGMVSDKTYYYTNVISNIVSSPEGWDTDSIDQVTTMEGIWSYLIDGIPNSLYVDSPDDGKPVPRNESAILYNNYVLGVPRLRQLRVRSDSCNVPEDFKRPIPLCFSSYSKVAEETMKYGPGNGTEWNYYSSSTLGGSDFWGLISYYDGGGYYRDFDLDKKRTIDILTKMKSNLWIDRATRVVFLDFTIYNANVNLFCIVKVVFELPPTGGVISSVSLRTVKLIRYISALDYFVLACEFIFVFFILYYIVEEILEIRQLRCPYFYDVWNLLDIVVIIISIVCIAFSIIRYFVVNQKFQKLLNSPKNYPDFTELGFAQTQFNNVLAIDLFFAWIKLFKYVSFNKTMTQLSSTLSKCAKDIGGFAIMFAIVYFAFAQLGYLIFGTQVDDYNSFANSAYTLLRTILGDFDLDALQRANRILGPIFFLSFVFFVFFVLLNMFLAIINDTYSEVKAEIATQKNEFEISDYFKRGFNNMMGKIGRRDKLIDIQNALKLADTDQDGSLSYDEVRTSLRRLNFGDLEIEMFMARYDMNMDKFLGEQEKNKMLADLEGQRLELDKEISSEENLLDQELEKSYVSPEEYTELEDRVDHMEGSMSLISLKIDTVLQRLDDMERNKHKRRDAMDKILDGMVTPDGDEKKH